jgi:2-hydroxychromene-2-carboxylate isomerase
MDVMTKQMIAWLSIGSTYTYLTAMRIQAVLKQHNIKRFRRLSTFVALTTN